MQTPVNKNIDTYKDDFFKGMSLKQTVLCAVTLFAGVGSFFFFHLVLNMPQTLSLYLVFPVALPFALLGFAKPDNTSLFTYLKRRHEVITMPVYRFVPLAFDMLKEVQEEEKETRNTKEYDKGNRLEDPLLEPSEEDPWNEG